MVLTFSHPTKVESSVVKDYGETVVIQKPWIWTEDFVKPVKTPSGKFGGQCVVFARNYLHIDSSDFGGYAGKIKPNSTEPAVGEVVLEITHTAVIESIQGDDLVLIESNYHRDERITEGRLLNINSPSIRGYFKP